MIGAEGVRLLVDSPQVWAVIEPLDSVRKTAIQLVELYDIRAADSLQLAAALEWCEGAPTGRVFLTADQRLHNAALLAGFDCKSLIVA
jgi:predicted nucleic acid-binding protein